MKKHRYSVLKALVLIVFASTSESTSPSAWGTPDRFTTTHVRVRRCRRRTPRIRSPRLLLIAELEDRPDAIWAHPRKPRTSTASRQLVRRAIYFHCRVATLPRGPLTESPNRSSLTPLKGPKVSMDRFGEVEHVELSKDMFRRNDERRRTANSPKAAHR